ncbi:MAG TPA: A24 family peptidase [Clostridia bacterium]|nr:A24 family peptidase [Clostridia bacterium]
MWKAIVITFAITAAFSDLRWRKIPRVLTVGGFVAGLVYHGINGGFLSALGAAIVGFGIGIALFSLGAIGGGDVKLIAALGAMLGFPSWSYAMLVSILAAGLIALVQVIRLRVLRRTLHNMAEILRSFYKAGLRQHPDLNVSNPSMVRSPFGVAAALGTVAAVFRL